MKNVMRRIGAGVLVSAVVVGFQTVSLRAVQAADVRVEETAELLEIFESDSK